MTEGGQNEMSDLDDHRSSDTQASGNTKQTLRARSFQFTLNEIEKYESFKNEFTKLKSMDFLISCKEVAPTTGKEHIHMYVHFNNPYKLSQKILSYKAHVEICRGSPKQNIEYINKGGNILDKIGTEPHQGRIYTVEEVKEAPIEMIPASLYNIRRKLDEEQLAELTLDDFEKEVEVYYIEGESGVGKTQKAKEIIRETFKKTGESTFNSIKHENGFWHGTGKSKIALYDDFRDSDMRAKEFINLVDYNKHRMNVKGGSILNEYTTIIITSVQKLETIYSNLDDEPRKQWMRRVKVIRMLSE